LDTAEGAPAQIASALRRDELSIALVYCLSMIFSENRSPLFRIMLRRTALRAANRGGARAVLYR